MKPADSFCSPARLSLRWWESDIRQRGHNQTCYPDLAAPVDPLQIHEQPSNSAPPLNSPLSLRPRSQQLCFCRGGGNHWRKHLKSERAMKRMLGYLPEERPPFHQISKCFPQNLWQRLKRRSIFRCKEDPVNSLVLLLFQKLNQQSLYRTYLLL